MERLITVEGHYNSKVVTDKIRKAYEESGTHAELLSQGVFYAELYNSQFEQAS